MDFCNCWFYNLSNGTVFLCSPAGCTCSKVTSTSIFPGVISSSTAPLRLSPVRHLSSPYALASTPTSRGGTLSAAGTSWRLWKKITSKRHSWELYKWGVFLFPPHVRLLMFPQAAGIPPSYEELLPVGSRRHHVWLLHGDLWQGAGEGELAAAVLSQRSASGGSRTAPPRGQQQVLHAFISTYTYFQQEKLLFFSF